MYRQFYSLRAPLCWGLVTCYLQVDAVPEAVGQVHDVIVSHVTTDDGHGERGAALGDLLEEGVDLWRNTLDLAVRLMVGSDSNIKVARLRPHALHPCAIQGKEGIEYCSVA